MSTFTAGKDKKKAEIRHTIMHLFVPSFILLRKIKL